jgi:hypothetical protein
MELVPSSFQSGRTEVDSSDRDQVASALEPANRDAVAHGWKLVSEGLTSDTEWFRLTVGGEPAVVLIDRSSPKTPRAKAFRIENGKWTEFATSDFPLLSDVVSSGSRDDGSVAYLATATRLGHARVLALEPTGFRLTPFDQSNWYRGVQAYIFLPMYFAFSLAMGWVLATVAWLLMWRNPARYVFGLQEVELASLLERGAARILDLSSIALATTGVLFVLNWIFQPDWIIFLEAIQQFDENGKRQPRLDLPQVIAPLRIAVTCACILITSSVMLVAMQGRCGLTPGKWICGLRTVRTSLRPCGCSLTVCFGKR